MSDLKSILAAYLIAQGAHTGGHLYQGSNPDNPMRDVPMSMNIQELAEDWDVKDRWSTPGKNNPYAHLYMSHKDYLDDNNRKSADIHGAGFAMQDRMRDTVDDPETKQGVATMNAIIKGLYLADVNMKLAKQLQKGKSSFKNLEGDIDGMEKASGNHYTKALVAASLLSDLYQAKNPKSKWSYGFDVIDGAPGGRINYCFK